MDVSYSTTRNNRNFVLPAIILILIVLLFGGAFWAFGKSKKLLSPLPEEPAVEIIFYTPTPEPVTPTSSPSATPKVAKTVKPTATPKKEQVTITPTKGKPTTTPTQATTATPTTKP